MEEQLKILLNKARSLPLLPGVYIMRDKDGKFIYIGKAKALKNRVSQYFGNQEKHYEKVRQMVSRVSDFDYIICDSEFEALILECSLIKQNKPKYNILLKDDKGYSYIHITNEDWPRLTEEKQCKPDGENIGPYNSSYMVKQAVYEAKKIYKLPLCTRTFSDNMKRSRPCLNYFIGLCQAPCSGKVKKSDYVDSINSAVAFLKKGSDETINILTVQMNEAAEKLEFEKAAKLRDKITAIQNIGQKQKVVLSPKPNQDVIAFVEGQKNACFEVFKFRSSRLCDREHFFVDTADDDTSARAQFIMQYYSMRDDIPPRILTDGNVELCDTVEKWLTEKRGKSVVITGAKKGEQKQLLDMCRTNAAERVAQKEGLSIRQTAALDELRSLLGLKKSPQYIEAYDISHTAGQDNVAGMIVFKDGRPYKKAYKKFAIKSFSGQDDCASMQEVLSRRMNEYELHKDEDEGFGRLPDLILLDGGLAQLHAALPVIRQYTSDVYVYGMVKDSHHRTRALIGEQGEIEIKATRSVFKLISDIQNEVHRFALGYHHTKSTNRNFSLQLNQIDGVGKKRAQELLKHFKNLNEVAAADVDKLMEVKGITIKIAQNIYNFYHNF